MNDDLLRFVRVWAVWENVSKGVLDLVAEWVAKSQLPSKLVRVEEGASKFSIKCRLDTEMELVPALSDPLPKLPDPSWFRISVSEAEFKGPVIAVVSNRGEELGGAFITESPNGERMMIHPFRDGVVVRRWKGRDGSKVNAHYLSVCQQGARYHLVVSPRLSVFIPEFSGPKDLEDFFQASRVPENLQDIIAAMVGFSRVNGKTFDPKWDGALADLHRPEGPSSKPRSDKEQRHGHEGGRSAKKPRPEVPEDKLPVVKPGASSKDFKEGVED